MQGHRSISDRILLGESVRRNVTFSCRGTDADCLPKAVAGLGSSFEFGLVPVYGAELPVFTGHPQVERRVCVKWPFHSSDAD